MQCYQGCCFEDVVLIIDWLIACVVAFYEPTITERSQARSTNSSMKFDKNCT